MAGNPYALDFSPINNVLANVARQRMQQAQLERQDRQFQATNALAQARLGMDGRRLDMAEQQFVAQQQQNALMDPLRVQQLQAQITNLQREPTTNDIREYQFAQKNGFGGGFLDYQQEKAKRAASAKGLGTVPIFGTGPDGKPAVMQLGQGSLVPALPPGGYSVDPRGVMKIDTGTGTQLVTQGGKTVTDVKKDIVGQKVAEATGKAQGQAQADLPRQLTNAIDAFGVVSKALVHPGLSGNFGVSGVFPNFPSGQAANAKTYLDQIGGKAFLEAFNSLKGGGQITEIEGAKATQAIARLQKSQSIDSARQALVELQGIMITGLKRAFVQAGKPVPSSEDLLALMRSKDPLSAMYGNAPGQGGKLQPAQPDPPVEVTTVEEALKLPPGTVFRTPDGKMKVR